MLSKWRPSDANVEKMSSKQLNFMIYVIPVAWAFGWYPTRYFLKWPQKWPQMSSKWHPNDLQMTSMTSNWIFFCIIVVLVALAIIWYPTWHIFTMSAKWPQKWPPNDLQMTSMASNWIYFSIIVVLVALAIILYPEKFRDQKCIFHILAPNSQMVMNIEVTHKSKVVD